MWNIIAANSFLDKRNKERQYERHRKTLSLIKSQIDNSAPKEYSFLTSRPKTRLQAYGTLQIT